MSGFLRIVLLGLALLALAPTASALAETPGEGVTTEAATTTPDQASKPKSQQEDTNATDSKVYAESLAALTKLFVLAVLLESALSIIFNWRVFLTYFSLRGVKTIIMVAVSYVFVRWFHIDIVADLIHAYQPLSPRMSGLPTELITALILAGGSTGVYNIMRGLGYRSGDRQEEISPQPPQDKAWIAVWAKRKDAVGEIFVTVREIRDATAKSPSPIAGVIGGRRPSLRELLLRNLDRFPQNGGYTVTPNVIYEIAVTAQDRNGDPLTRLGKQYVFAKGAIVDFDVTV
jgi:hypothetical protein